MNSIKVRRGLFFLSLIVPHIFFDIENFSFCNLFGTSLCSDGFAIKKAFTKVIFWKKLHKFLLEKIKGNNYFVTFPKLIGLTSINFNSDITCMKNNVSILNLDNFITFEKPANARRKISISLFKEVIQIRSFHKLS